MGFATLLLIGIIWLLWTLHLDLVESNDRQRGLKTAINALSTKLEKLAKGSSNLEFTAAQAAATVNLNSASKAKLQTLPKVGAVGAEHIIAARPFDTVEELQKVQGITDSIYQQLVGRVSI
jgi:DNA uptake protein ComE-like DNA-binding protein